MMKWDNINDFGSEVIQDIRNKNEQRLNDMQLEIEIEDLKKTVSAMKEVGVEDKKIIKMLQKYWDLRLSEAEGFVNIEDNY